MTLLEVIGMQGGSIPEDLYGLFWDTDPAQLDPGRHARFVIERVLEYGDIPAVRWLLSVFSVDQVREAVEHSRRLSPRTRSFWLAYFRWKGTEVLAR